MTKTPVMIGGPVKIYTGPVGESYPDLDTNSPGGNWKLLDTTIPRGTPPLRHFMREYGRRKMLLVDIYTRPYFNTYGAAYHRTTNIGDYPR